jgi:hypothetical protein
MPNNKGIAANNLLRGSFTRFNVIMPAALSKAPAVKLAVDEKHMKCSINSYAITKSGRVIRAN